jgi:hypothetical protein
MTKLLVASGKHSPKSVEIINLDEKNASLVCDDLPDLLVGVEGATGQLFNGKIPIICGGLNPVTSETNCSCQALQRNSWNIAPEPTACRRKAGSGLLRKSEKDEFLFIAGGNFINVKLTIFSYERHFSSYILALSKNSYEKFL